MYKKPAIIKKVGIFIRFIFIISLASFIGTASWSQGKKIGLFENHTDVGNPARKGLVNFNPLTHEYLIAGAGANIWADRDEFQFVWKRMTGNFILTARGKFVGKGVDAHRKFGWMVRASLEPDAPHANVVVHGDGLTSLQYRNTSKAMTEEIKSSVTGADVIQLERRGNRFIMSVARFGDTFVREELDSLVLGDQVYVGLFVCSHNKDVTEKAIFDNVRIVIPTGPDFVQYRTYLGSNIEILDVKTGKSKIIYYEPRSLQAPNWTKDGKSLIYNSDGLLYKFDLAKKTPVVINTGFANSNNNDHLISFSGTMLGISHHSKDDGNKSIVYTVPITGGTPKKVTPTGHSYLHGWSPDGKYMLYVGERNSEYDIYKMSVNGGEEIRLTDAKGLDDGPEYTPDGKYIYFNSTRSGSMQIWRMKPDGSNQEQITDDDLNNWFPHISPDGKTIVYITFGKDVPADSHPFYKHVYIRSMPAGGGKSKVIAYLYGGQGTINVPSWSPDSKKIAFVSNTDQR